MAAPQASGQEAAERPASPDNCGRNRAAAPFHGTVTAIARAFAAVSVIKICPLLDASGAA